jgi:hypothetical protein
VHDKQRSAATKIFIFGLSVSYCHRVDRDLHDNGTRAKKLRGAMFCRERTPIRRRWKAPVGKVMGYRTLAQTMPMNKKPKLIPLSVWAYDVFGEHAPHRNTLLNWVRNGKIVPFPVKVGRSYFVEPDARYFDPVAEKIRRMLGE